MIELTRLNGSRLAVNSDLITYAEAAPDTLLTMVTGEKLIVAESLAEVSERVEMHRARTLAEAARMFPSGPRLAPVTGLHAMAAVHAIDAARADEQAEPLDGESTGRMRRRRREES